jgi:nucleoside phosphorylase
MKTVAKLAGFGQIEHAFLFALRRESAPFARRLGLVHALPDAPCASARVETRRGGAVIMETGVGAARAAAATRWVLEHVGPRLVVACGFAGALSPTFKIGDVLVASEVVEPDEDLHWRTAVPAELGELPVGRLVTVPQLVGRPAD